MIPFGQLKLSLLQSGVYIPQNVLEARQADWGLGAQSLELALALSDDFIVKSHLKTKKNGGPSLDIQDGQIRIASGKESMEVEVIPTPGFLRESLQGAGPAAHSVSLDGYCLNFFLRTTGEDKKLNLSIDEIATVIQSAFEEGAADLVQFNMDYCQDENLCLDRLGPIVEAIKNKFSAFVALRGFPPKNKRIIDKFYASGVDLLNYPLEGFANSDALAAAFPENQILQGLEYAVEIFPQGAVSTELDLQAAPLEMIQAKIDHLSRSGVVPILKLPTTVDASENAYAKIKEAARRLSEAAGRDKLNLKWLYPSCHSVTALDAAYFTEAPESARLSAKPVYQGRLSRKAVENFTILRRKLRVKNISDSYESAGL